MFKIHTIKNTKKKTKKKTAIHFETQDCTIHAWMEVFFQSCKFFQESVSLVLLQLVLALKVAQLVLNNLQQ